MKISVITVVFNGEKYIEDSIKSYISQSFHDKELIIVDGMSSDNTQKIVNKYSGYISQYIREPDANLYDAMNKGIQKATGDIIHLLNHDDYYNNENVLSKVNEHFSTNSSDIIHGPMIKVDSDNNIVSSMGIKKRYFKNALFSPFNHPTCFVKSNIYQINSFDISFSTAADYDWMLKVINSSTISINTIDFYTVNFRTVGLTSNNWFPPSKQLFRLLRANNINLVYVLIGISFRIIRNISKKIIKF
ncbi:MAG: glycosyltransferase [Flavobacteriaceae bacterium]|nr:glycosyltransferase [Flavobacteriaceae bacterium]